MNMPGGMVPGPLVPIGGPQQPPPEPKFKTPALAKRWEELKALMAANQKLQAEVNAKAHQYGGQFLIPPEQIDKLQFAALLDVLYPGDTAHGQKARLDLDFKVQERLAVMLEQAMAGIGQAALQAGSMLPPDQMEALLKQQSAGPGLGGGLSLPPERRRR